jgi:hypothetical protein
MNVGGGGSGTSDTYCTVPEFCVGQFLENNTFSQVSKDIPVTGHGGP